MVNSWLTKYRAEIPTNKVNKPGEKGYGKDNEIYLSIDVLGARYDVKFDDVREVTELENSVEQIYLMNQSMRITTAFSLIGRNVKGTYEEVETVGDVKRTKTVDIEGIVEKVRRDGPAIYLTVNGKKYIWKM